MKHTIHYTSFYFSMISECRYFHAGRSANSGRISGSTAQGGRLHMLENACASALYNGQCFSTLYNRRQKGEINLSSADICLRFIFGKEELT
jgi:hypothetical protein